MNRRLSKKEFNDIVENLSDLKESIDAFHGSDDSTDSGFKCSVTDSTANSSLEEFEVKELGEPSEEELDNQIEGEDSINPNADALRPQIPDTNFNWIKNVDNFVLKYVIPLMKSQYLHVK